jgi:hypothetical protein
MKALSGGDAPDGAALIVGRFRPARNKITN